MRRCGLPDGNSGRFLSECVLSDFSGVKIKTADPLHGNSGGLPELVVPDPNSQIILKKITRLNPEY